MFFVLLSDTPGGFAPPPLGGPRSVFHGLGMMPVTLKRCVSIWTFQIMEFISYSSAILSITLSIFAIQYTYTSNVQIQQQFEKINNVAESVKDTADKLNMTSKQLDDNLETILERLKNIDQSQKEMYSQLSNMNTAIPKHNDAPQNYLPGT